MFLTIFGKRGESTDRQTSQEIAPSKEEVRQLIEQLKFESARNERAHRDVARKISQATGRE